AGCRLWRSSRCRCRKGCDVRAERASHYRCVALTASQLQAAQTRAFSRRSATQRHGQGAESRAARTLRLNAERRARTLQRTLQFCPVQELVVMRQSVCIATMAALAALAL